MTTQQMTSQGPTDQATVTGSGRRRWHRLDWWLLALLPLSGLLAFIVLQLMAAASASATGGCGGG